MIGQLRLVAALLAGVLFPATLAAQGRATAVPLYPGLGDYRHRVTANWRAQQYFDQGLRLTYAFGRRDAAASFRYATTLDPRCAMCWWGVALALGPNINDPIPDSTRSREAWHAAQRAQSLASRASEGEQAYIAAMAKRWAAPGAGRRGALDSAYADAMREVAAHYPGDVDALVNLAEALELLRAWNWYRLDGSPMPGTDELVGVLERALALDPAHAGACHYYIHAVEGSRHPERAEACADRLGALMPGASHLVHMPGHIYLRLGRYNDAVIANRHAHEVDDAAAADGPQRRARGVYPAHNLDFLVTGAMWDGQSAVALDAGRLAARDSADWGMALWLFAMARFGHWQDILAAPTPAVKDTVARGYRVFVIGLARVRTGDVTGARAALDTVRALRAAAGDTASIASSPKVMLGIAAGMLSGEIAAREQRPDDAIRELRAAAALEDSLRYDEPPDWPLPVREFLGARLLEAGRAGEAEAAYREDLTRNPGNGWALFGLAASLRAQHQDATDAEQRFQRAWQRADVRLSGSVF